MKNFIKSAVAVSLSIAPFAALAATPNDGLGKVFVTIGELLGIITPVIVGLALLGFFWGLAMYVLNFSGDDKDKKKGRDMMVYGTLVLFVMVSVWGIVQILQDTFDISNGGDQNELRGNEIPSVTIPN
jgi:uncharacterized membrane-anchored protein